MRKFILLLNFIFFVPFSGQDLRVDIENQFKDYNALIASHQFEKALVQYGNEEFLKLFPLKDLVAMMDETLNDPEIVLNLIAPSDIMVSDEIVDEKEQKFVKLSFHQKLEMKFKEEGLDEKNLLAIFQGTFGKDHVKYDDQTEFFLIETFKTAVANSIDLKNWKFTVLEKKQIPVLRRFIPEQFLIDLK